MITLCSKTIDGTFQLHFQIKLKEQSVVTHRNTVISHLIYLKFAFAPVCIVSSGRLFVHKGKITCASELQFSCNHKYIVAILKSDYRTFPDLFDLSLEHC